MVDVRALSQTLDGGYLAMRNSQMKKTLRALLVVALVLMPFSERLNAANSDANQGIDRIKTHLTQKGIGKKVTVELKNKSEIQGSIIELREESFDLRIKTGEIRTVQYSDVDQLKEGHSKATKIALIALAGVVVLVILLHVGNNKVGGFE